MALIIIVQKISPPLLMHLLANIFVFTKLRAHLVWYFRIIALGMSLGNRSLFTPISMKSATNNITLSFQASSLKKHQLSSTYP